MCQTFQISSAIISVRDFHLFLCVFLTSCVFRTENKEIISHFLKLQKNKFPCLLYSLIKYCCLPIRERIVYRQFYKRNGVLVPVRNRLVLRGRNVTIKRWILSTDSWSGWLLKTANNYLAEVTGGSRHLLRRRVNVRYVYY